MKSILLLFPLVIITCLVSCTNDNEDSQANTTRTPVVQQVPTATMALQSATQIQKPITKKETASSHQVKSNNVIVPQAASKNEDNVVVLPLRPREM